MSVFIQDDLYFRLVRRAYSPHDYIEELSRPLIEANLIMLDLIDKKATKEEILSFLDMVEGESEEDEL